ncbi:MAG: glycosyltransferase family 87 protein [Spirochaetota bacterium]
MMFVRAFRNAINDKRLMTFLAFAAFFAIIFYAAIPHIISRFVDVPWKYLDWIPLSPRNIDFQVTYDYLHRFVKGVSPYSPAFARIYSEGHLSYPPLHPILYIPITLPFSFALSREIWHVLSVLCTLTGIFFAVQFVRRKIMAAVFLTALNASASFFYFHIERGQTDTMTLLFVSIFLYSYFIRKNRVLAAVFFVLAAGFKLTPAIFVLIFLVRRDWRTMLYAALIGIVVVIVTGPQNWIAWASMMLSVNTGTYMGQEVDHALLYLVLGFQNGNFDAALLITRLLSIALVAGYTVSMWFTKERDKHVVIELAVLTVIMNLLANWSFNYKLVLLVFFFLLPFYFMELPKGTPYRRWLVLYFAALLVMAPIYNETVARIPYSLIAHLPLSVIPPNPIEPLVERRVAVLLFICTVLFIARFAWNIIHDRFSWGKRIGVWFNRPKQIAAAVMLLVVLSVSFFAAIAVSSGNERYRIARAAFGTSRPISDEISLAGCIVRMNRPTNYDIDVLIDIKRPIPKHCLLSVNGTYGAKTAKPITISAAGFPDIITPLFPSGKCAVFRKTISLSPGVVDITAAFADLSCFKQYGTAVNIGQIDLARLSQSNFVYAGSNGIEVSTSGKK